MFSFKFKMRFMTKMVFCLLIIICTLGLLTVSLLRARLSATNYSTNELSPSRSSYNLIEQASSCKETLCRSQLRMANRKEKVNTFCKQYPYFLGLKTDVIQKRSNFTIFAIPNCGSMFMVRFLEYLIKDNGIPETNNILTGHDMLPYAVMIVRHPYHRLFSVYKHFLFYPSIYWETMGSDIVQTIRGKSMLSTDRNIRPIGYDVTFVEFVAYVIMMHKKSRDVNSMIAPMTSFCNLCGKKAHFIGKLETLSDDLDLLVYELIKYGLINNTSWPTEEIETEVKYRMSSRSSHDMFILYEKYRLRMSTYKLIQRLWSTQQMNGKISSNIVMPFFKDDSAISETEFVRSFDSARFASKHNVWLAKQSMEAMIQAYKTVPMNLLQEIKNIFKYDFQMFDYNDSLDFLLNRTVDKISNHNYFAGL